MIRASCITAVAFLALIPGLACITASAWAQEHLGPIDNVLLKNPYASPAGGYFGRGVVAGDFDGDGVSDLTVSENGGSRLRVLRGVPFSIGTTHLFTFFPEAIQMSSHGYEMAIGDFDGDGRDEIAVGASGTSYNGVVSAGNVYVMDRAANGAWSEQSHIHAGGAFPGAPQASANLGNSLAAGDFNGDGFDDLAIGIRGQIVGGVAKAGAIMVTYGSASGITASNARIVHRNSDGLGFTPREDDYFGWALAAADFDGDGNDDLAIGVLYATCPNGDDRAGAAIVLNGSTANGITSAGSHIWRPGTLGIAGNCAMAGSFGQALAVGRFSGSSPGVTRYWDLVIGAPRSDGQAGAVHVIRGSQNGLSAAGNQRLVQPVTPGVASGGGRFGSALAAGLLSKYCVLIFCRGDSLAIGAPFATVNDVENAGAVWTFHPANDVGADGIHPGSARAILPLPPMRVAGPHANDQFGNALTIGDFNDDSRRDLAIGAYLLDDGGDADAGGVQVLYQTERLFANGFD